MDFGLGAGLDHGLGLSSSSSSHIFPSSSDKTLYGSGFCSNNKLERSEVGAALGDVYWRSSKLSKTNSCDADFSASTKAMLLLHDQKNSANLLLRSNSTSLSFLDTTAAAAAGGGHPQHQMLSFSSPKPEPFLLDKTSQNASLPYFPHSLSAYNTRNITGFNSGSLVNGVNMHEEIGPFTPSQWMELEQQALIYKYITANVPIPSNLLIPIRKAFDSVAFSSFPAGLLRPNSLGWGAFHLGFANNSDPEPGRCRRTDGKKWRCSRDAVADQKYCERHMNRGRHRSRKPVEGQTGHSLAGANAAAAAAAATAAATPTTSTTSTVALLGCAASNSHTSNNNNQIHHQSFEIGASDSSAAATTHNMSRMQSSHGGLSLLSKNSLFSNPKHQIPYEESSRSSDQFGIVKNSESQNPLRQFIDVDWPDKNNHTKSNNHHHTTVTNWPESDRTQLSMSISGVSSSEQNTASADHHHHQQRQALNLIPMSWESSLGGPLGEVLHHTNNNNNNVDSGECKRPLSSSVLNLMTEGWDSSPPMGSSPTGVLQKTAFGSRSNSSAGSSPRADNHKDVLASAHLNSSSSL